MLGYDHPDTQLPARCCRVGAVSQWRQSRRCLQRSLGGITQTKFEANYNPTASAD